MILPVKVSISEFFSIKKSNLCSSIHYKSFKFLYYSLNMRDLDSQLQHKNKIIKLYIK